MVKTEVTFKTKEGRTFLGDISYSEKGVNMPLVVFCHGFKGFKDWGAWDLVAKEFAESGCCFVKFNFSGNGVGLNDPLNFTNLNAFAENTITQELEDLKTVLDYFKNSDDLAIDKGDISLIGHSRGAATTLIEASKNKEVKKLITWAGVFDLYSWVKKFDLLDWKEKGSLSFLNSRTNQDMVINYSFVEDLEENRETYSANKAIEKIEIPLLMLHGDKDVSVPFKASQEVYDLLLHSILINIEGGDHTFGVKHPHDASTALPEAFAQVIENTIEFVLD